MEKWKIFVDKVNSVLLTSPSKVFDYLDNKSLIPKLNAHVSDVFGKMHLIICQTGNNGIE